MSRRKQQTLQDYMLEWQIRGEEKQQRERTQRTNAKLKYNKKNYSSLQVFLEPELVEAFKIKTKELGFSQASIIRSFLKEFLSL